MTDVWNTAVIENEHNKVLSERRKLLKALWRFMNREIGVFDNAEKIAAASENDMLWALEQLTPEEIADVITGLADALLEGDED